MVSDSNTEGVSSESVFGWRDGEGNKGDNVIRKDLLPSNTEFCKAKLSKSLRETAQLSAGRSRIISACCGGVAESMIVVLSYC